MVDIVVMSVVLVLSILSIAIAYLAKTKTIGDGLLKPSYVVVGIVLVVLFLPPHLERFTGEYFSTKNGGNIFEPGADLQGRNLDEKVLVGVNLAGANLDNASVRQSILYGANLTGINLANAKLVRSDMAKSALNDADLSEADMRSVNLRSASLVGAHLIGVNLSHARLDGADLSYAKLKDSNLSGVSLDGVILRGADLTGVTGLTKSELNNATLDKNTLLPDYLK